MGLGDEILVTGQARQLQETDPRLVYVVGRDAGPRWHCLWDGNPRLTQNKHGAQLLKNGPGARPYIDYQRSTPERWAYTDWRSTPGELYLPRLEPSDYVLIEPHVKKRASPNKQWGRWQALVDLMPEVRWLQVGPAGTEVLHGAAFIETIDFRQACIQLSGVRAAVLPEGGLHHAAAALGIRSIVLFGSMTSPRNTGYDTHVNLAVDDPEALGWRIPHPACQAAWDKITPDFVAEQLKGILNG